MKNFFKFIFSKKFLFNLLAAIALFFLICFITLRCIDRYTTHGVAIEVPELRNITVEDADLMLENEDLEVEVIDSVFRLDRKPGVIIEQNPPALSKIKKGRKVYVTINAKTKKKVVFPDVKEYSFRQAQTILESMGLKVASIEYVPSEFKNLVQYAKVNGKIIDVNAELPVSTNVVLVVGKGLSDEKITLPSFRGLTLEEARLKSFDININLGAIRYDVNPVSQEDTKNYVIYKQSPITGAQVNLGKYIDVWLTRDKSKVTDTPEEVQLPDDLDGIEDFFQ